MGKKSIHIIITNITEDNFLINYRNKLEAQIVELDSLIVRGEKDIEKYKNLSNYGVNISRSHGNIQYYLIDRETGKKKYAEYQADIERILRDSDALRLKMNALIEKDAEVFEPLSKAYGIPKDEPGRDEILEKALKTASDAPMEIVRTASEVMALIEELTVKGSRLAISDVGVAAAACEACAKGAVMNVYINTKLMKDRKVAEAVNKEADALVKDIVSRAEAAYNNVKNSLI